MNSKRKRERNAALCVAVGLTAALACTGCSTSAATHAKSYFKNTSSIVNTLTSSGKSSTAAQASSASSTQATQLATPTDFTVDANGNFSFTGVDNATQYLLYYCEPGATDDGADYLYSSEPISANDSGQYTGSLEKLIQAAYGQYLVKVYALPDLTDTAYSMSGAAMAEYAYTGTQSDPEIGYYWDATLGNLEIVLANVDDYTYEAYPNAVEVTFTNAEDETDAVTVAIEDITADSYTASAAGITKGTAYNITAAAKSDSEYVTNPETDTIQIAQAQLFGDANVLSANYTYSDGWASFPRLADNFPLDGSGSAGTITGKFGSVEAEMATTATAASSGAAYSYTFSGDFGMFAIVGTLDLNSDGSLTMAEEGGGPVAAGTVTGSWVDNGDGTATLNYSPADISS